MKLALPILKGTQAHYDALATKDENTLYITTDTGNMYLGETALGAMTDVTSFATIAQLLMNIKADRDELLELQKEILENAERIQAIEDSLTGGIMPHDLEIISRTPVSNPNVYYAGNTVTYEFNSLIRSTPNTYITIINKTLNTTDIINDFTIVANRIIFMFDTYSIFQDNNIDIILTEGAVTNNTQTSTNPSDVISIRTQQQQAYVLIMDVTNGTSPHTSVRTISPLGVIGASDIDSITNTNFETKINQYGQFIVRGIGRVFSQLDQTITMDVRLPRFETLVHGLSFATCSMFDNSRIIGKLDMPSFHSIFYDATTQNATNNITFMVNTLFTEINMPKFKIAVYNRYATSNTASFTFFSSNALLRKINLPLLEDVFMNLLNENFNLTSHTSMRNLLSSTNGASGVSLFSQNGAIEEIYLPSFKGIRFRSPNDTTIQNNLIHLYFSLNDNLKKLDLPVFKGYDYDTVKTIAESSSEGYVWLCSKNSALTDINVPQLEVLAFRRRFTATIIGGLPMILYFFSDLPKLKTIRFNSLNTAFVQTDRGSGNRFFGFLNMCPNLENVCFDELVMDNGTVNIGLANATNLPPSQSGFMGNPLKPSFLEPLTIEFRNIQSAQTLSDNIFTVLSLSFNWLNWSNLTNNAQQATQTYNLKINKDSLNVNVANRTWAGRTWRSITLINADGSLA